MKQQHIDWLAKHGIGFTVEVKTPAGVHNVELQPEDVLAYIEDPDSVSAKYLGLTGEQYAQYLSDEGMIICAARTKSGRRCKNIVEGPIGIHPHKWLSRQGEVCTLHSHGKEFSSNLN